MTFKQFLKIYSLYVAHSKRMTALYKLGIEADNLTVNQDTLVDILMSQILTEYGTDWFFWFMYEKGGIDGKINPKIKGHDGDGTEICKDLKGLYDYLIKNKYFKV